MAGEAREKKCTGSSKDFEPRLSSSKETASSLPPTCRPHESFPLSPLVKGQLPRHCRIKASLFFIESVALLFPHLLSRYFLTLPDARAHASNFHSESHCLFSCLCQDEPIVIF
jgi:hypothetical protein